MPNEDYEAIEAAVMETARGRWFLMEFMRRNRNADTKVLLEAIARLENQMTEGKHAPTTPHQPVTSTAVVSSAGSELFAVEPPPSPTAVAFPAMPEPPELAWVDEPEVDMDRPVQPDIFHLDDDLILPTEAVKPPAPAAPPKSGLPDFGKSELKPATADLRTPEPPAKPESDFGKFALKPTTAPAQPAAPKAAEPKLEASQPPAQSRMLAGALAQAEEALARTNEPAPPPPPSAFSPAPADPVELDTLSFEEKSVYFG
jgi:hypothetical protein